jgi:hypothetical protein
MNGTAGRKLFLRKTQIRREDGGDDDDKRDKRWKEISGE